MARQLRKLVRLALELLQQAKTKGHKEAAKFLQKHLKFGRLW